MNPFTYTVDTLPFLATFSPLVILGLVIALAAWTLILKGFALWFAARNGHRAWFIVLLLVNTLGILELAYIFVFRKQKTVPAAPVAGTEETA